MGGATLLLMGGGIGTVSVTSGSANVFDPKLGINISQYGYSSAANSISGVALGSRLPTTLLGATINGIFESDDNNLGTGVFKLILNGNQTALSIAGAIVNGTTYAFGAPSFAGGQTTWTSGSHASGDPFGGSTADVTFF